MEVFSKLEFFVESAHLKMLVYPSIDAGWLRLSPNDRPANCLGRLGANMKIVAISWIAGAVRFGVHGLEGVVCLVIALTTPIFLQFGMSKRAFCLLGRHIKQMGHGVMLSIPFVNVCWMKCMSLHRCPEPLICPDVDTSEEEKIKSLVPKETVLGWGDDGKFPVDELKTDKEKISEDVGGGRTLALSQETIREIKRVARINGKETPIEDSKKIPYLYEEISKVFPPEVADEVRDCMITVAFASLHQDFWQPAAKYLMIKTDTVNSEEKNSTFYDNIFTWNNEGLEGQIKKSFVIGEDPEQSNLKVGVTRHFYVARDASAIAVNETYEILDSPSQEAK